MIGSGSGHDPLKLTDTHYNHLEDGFSQQEVSVQHRVLRPVSLMGDENSHTPRLSSRTHRATLQCRETPKTRGWTDEEADTQQRKKKRSNVSKIRDKDENSTEFGGDFLHEARNAKIPVFKIRRHGGTVFHGRGEFSEFLLCLLSPDNTKSHG